MEGSFTGQFLREILAGAAGRGGLAAEREAAALAPAVVRELLELHDVRRLRSDRQVALEFGV